MTRFIYFGLVAMTVIGAAGAQAAEVAVKVENLNPTGGLYFTPVWLGFHDGSFDLFDDDGADIASTGLKNLAEDGDFTAINGELTAAQASALAGAVTDPDGFGGAPIIDPGDVETVPFTVDTSNHRFLSLAAMAIPSNDAFVGTPDAIELFDAGGNFNGPVTLTFFGRDIFDAGTEQNTEMDAAFINQAAGGDGIDTNSPIVAHVGFIDSIGNPGGTAVILGGTTAAGTTIDSVLGDFTRNGGADPQLRITITPEPASAAILVIGAGAMMIRRRRAA